MSNPWIYKSIFLYSSLQFCGNIEEYFRNHTKKLVVYIVMPRLRNEGNLVRVYKMGKLIQEAKVKSSENFILYYYYWLVGYWKFLLLYFNRNDRFIVLSSHPISFFGMNFQKLIRPGIHFAYWIGDYFPPVNLSLVLFEKLKKFYHDRVTFNFYLSDTIHKIFNNGNLISNSHKQTIMWGIKPTPQRRLSTANGLTILFVGLLKRGQGIESILKFLSENSKHTINIIGVCSSDLYEDYSNQIKQYSLAGRVFFPNKFYSDAELFKLSRKCHIGIALYETSKSNATYYTDPGKVKTYAELGLPIVMSNTSSIAPYIKRFKAGEIVDEKTGGISGSLNRIVKNYDAYLNGLSKFNTHFFYESYYKPCFVSLESV